MSSRRSKVQPQSELHDPRIARQAGDGPDCTGAQIRARLAELRGVGQIENLPAELQAGPLRDGEIAMDREVENISVRSPQNVAPRVAILSRRLQREGVRTRWEEAPACRVGRSVEPAIHVAHHLRRAGHVANCELDTERVDRVADSAAGRNRKRLSPAEGLAPALP